MDQNSAQIHLGPYYSFWSGPFLLSLEIDGDMIISSKLESGYCMKGIENNFIGKDPCFCIPLVDRLDGECAVFCERLFCEAVESLLEFKVPQRALDIRSIFSELNRITSHLSCLSKIAKASGAETSVHFFLRERETLLELFELITGARFSFNFMRVGGVANDISDGFLEKVNLIIINLKQRLREYNDILTYNYSFIGRTAGVGALHYEKALMLGLTGVNLRASGHLMDYRDRNYEALCSFTVSTGKGEMGVQGDCFDRYLIRLREVNSSLDILSYLIKNIEKGPFFRPETIKTEQKSGSIYHHIETPRGNSGCFLSLDEEGLIDQIHFKTPSLQSLYVFSDMIIGQRIQDLDMIYASLDINVSEADK